MIKISLKGWEYHLLDFYFSFSLPFEPTIEASVIQSM